MSILTIPRARRARGSVRGLANRSWRAIRDTMLEWRRRRMQRAELAAMSEIERRDIGLGDSAAKFEASKPFWRA